jgi:hypothetical protein
MYAIVGKMRLKEGLSIHGDELWLGAAICAVVAIEAVTKWDADAIFG